MEEQEFGEFSPIDLAKDTIRETLARNLHLARKGAKMTQVELAEEAGVARSQITSVEMGDADPKLSTLTALATALGIGPSLLLLDEKELQNWLKLHSGLAEEINATLETVVSKEELYEIRRLAQSELRKRQYKSYEIEMKDTGLLKTIKSTGVTAESAGKALVIAAICAPLVPIVGPVVGAALGLGAGTGFLLSSLTKLKR